MNKAQVAGDVLDYLAAHPDAEDTLEGIIEWWLERQEIIRHTGTVKAAVDDLVARGLVIERKGHDARTFYRVKLKNRSALPHSRRGWVDKERSFHSMPLKITNRSGHLLIIPLNSGRTIHLAPGEASDAIEDYELEKNEHVARLEHNGLIASESSTATAEALVDTGAASGGQESKGSSRSRRI